MDLEAYNAFCAALTGATHHILWGDHDVFKVGEKMFAIGGVTPEGIFTCTFKVDPALFDMVKDSPGLRPAPYLASRGMSWVQAYTANGLSDAELSAYIARSHALVAAGLSKKRRLALGL